ncbi:single-stranded DNA-binding protein [Lachnospira multipara]|uniref:single-stranded DNA-binding protein n=1 Tax=Lachnospira multipara TaxID=28051 RepID=UPI0003F809D3|nr:single-stranded DNA-binding protein [Lachnospira multipara]
MNKTILMGRLTADPEVRYSSGEKATAVARFTLAVNRTYTSEGQPNADFIRCIAFGKRGEFAEKYLHKGTKIVLAGHIQTGSYDDKDGKKVYTTDVVVDEMEFAESKSQAEQSQASSAPVAENASRPAGEEWMPIPDNLDYENLPFN